MTLAEIAPPTFHLGWLDYAAFGAYILVLSSIGFFAGRKEKENTAEYFLAGRSLPWYVVGCSYIAANISTEHFIGMIGAAYLYGICVATPEWSSIIAFSFLIWIFIPFLLSAKVFTTPEFLEMRFNSSMRTFFALVTVISNVVAFLAAVIYGGGLVLRGLFGWEGEFANVGSVVILGATAGFWAIYGGLKSVAWMDLLTLTIKLGGGLMVTVFGLWYLSNQYDGSRSLVTGFEVMIERNEAKTGVFHQAVQQNVTNMLSDAAAKMAAGGTNGVTEIKYNRLSVIQPLTHQVTPWSHWVMSFFYIGLWYTVINQFMIQRVLGAKNMYHARMGIVLAGYLKLLLPFIIVVPGLIYFAMKPDFLTQLPWTDSRAKANNAYIDMVQTLIPVGFRGLLLAALFGAIQSTVSAVLNSTSTIFTVDFYKRHLRPRATEQEMVRVGVLAGVVFLVFAIVLAYLMDKLKFNLFVYIQTLYTFFAPPFSAVFLLASLWRRINGVGALTAVIAGFIFGILVKVYVDLPGHPAWLEPYANQGILNWGFCMFACVVVSLLSAPPRPEQITDNLTFNWQKMRITGDLGAHWYSNVAFWWFLSVLGMLALIFIFGVLL
jgi:SSS family solute:Na+ symporter